MSSFNYANVSRNKRKRGATNVYVNGVQRKALISEIGDAGALLYTYYVEKSGMKNFKFTDKSAASALGWNIHKVRRYRTLLARGDWFYQSTFKNASKEKVTMTCLGKETVTAFKNKKPFWEDLVKVQQVMDRLEIQTVEELNSQIIEAKEIFKTL